MPGNANADLIAELARLQQHLQGLTMTNLSLNEMLEAERARVAAAQEQLQGNGPIVVADERESPATTSGRRERSETDEDSYSHGRTTTEDVSDEDSDEEEERRRCKARYRSLGAAAGAADSSAAADGDDDDHVDAARCAEEEVTYRSCSYDGDPASEEADMLAAMACGAAPLDAARLDIDKLKRINGALEALAQQGAACNPAAVEATLAELSAVLSS